MKLEAITRKAVREGQDYQQIFQSLRADPYFQRKAYLFGEQEATEIVKNTIKNAISIETYSQKIQTN